jgi:uncharacterized protein
MEAMGKGIEGGRAAADVPPRELPIRKVLFLIFVPSLLLMLAYFLAGPLAERWIPSLLLFFVLAVPLLFSVQLAVILAASKKEYGRYSLQSAFVVHQPLAWWKIILYGVLAWGFAGLMTVTVLPLEQALWAPIAERAAALLPRYFDWTDMEFLAQYPRDTLLLTAGVILVLNVFVGPIVEELFFRGYLTARVSRLGRFAPLLITVLFSLYHFWLPFQNLFRILAFFPGFYIAWKMRNIYIAIVLHCLSNLVSTIGLIAAILAVV